MIRAFHLVPSPVSSETTAALANLAADAKAGKLVGLAYVGIYKGRQYVIHTTGYAHQNTTVAIAMASMLQFHLQLKEIQV